MQMSINENVTSLGGLSNYSPRVPFREKPVRGARCKLHYVAYIMQRERSGYPFFVAKSYGNRTRTDGGGRHGEFSIDGKGKKLESTLERNLCCTRAWIIIEP